MEDPTVPIPKLPNDVILEILTWLPVKPLLKFKCVCKSWRTLISSQQFVRAHLRNSQLDPNSTQDILILSCLCDCKQYSVNSMLYESISEAFELSYPFESESPFRLRASCDGLILLTTEGRELFLWNPSTRTGKKLPEFGAEVDIEGYHTYGLGYDKSSDDYKLVGLFNNNVDMCEVIVLVYSLRSDQWKRMKNFNGRTLMSNVGFANGKLYWIAHRDIIWWDLLCYNLEEEEFEILQMPSYVKIGYPYSLRVSGGSLCLLCSERTSADVWIMDDFSWTKAVTIPRIDNFWGYNSIRLLYVLKNGVVLLLYGSVFVIYDAKDCSFRYPEVKDWGDSVATYCTYVESLVSPVG